VQVIAIPVTDDQIDYLYGIAAELKKHRIRVEVDGGTDRMQKKIRTAQQAKVPFMLIAGAQDAENPAGPAVSFRYRDGSQRNGVPVDQAVAEIASFVAGRANHSPTDADFS
jgi:threonyl-tRNA synthetase